MLGTIFVGIATPTEGGAMGALGALILAVAKRRLSIDLLTLCLFAFVVVVVDDDDDDMFG